LKEPEGEEMDQKKTQKKKIPNTWLRQERELRGWSQAEMAGLIGTTARVVSRWETGENPPGPFNRTKLHVLFEKNPVKPGADQIIRRYPLYENIPVDRSPYFTSRDDVLQKLRELLVTDKATALKQAVKGLGGTGKTQIALEYAYRYYNTYQAILWAVADSYEMLFESFVRIAETLNLPERNEQEQKQAVRAVRRWLGNNTEWLLILDNLEDPNILADFLPLKYDGHVLITTRAQTMGICEHSIEVEKMSSEDGALLLLRRAKIISLDDPLKKASENDQDVAKKVSEEVDGLPLALDQAGAYIAEHRYSLSAYLDLYRVQHVEFLRRRGNAIFGHPASVYVTFELCFERIKQNNQAAAELLRFCAYLHPDTVLEDMIVTGASKLGPLLGPVASYRIQLNDAIDELLKYSLMRRNIDGKTLNMHRLVQAVILDKMGKQDQQQLAERVVQVIDSAYEAAGSNRVNDHERYTIIQITAQYDSHALYCAKLIEQLGIENIDAVFLLLAAGNSLREQGLYKSAKPLLKQAVKLCERIKGPEDSLTAHCITGLALLYEQAGQFDRAEPLYQRALEINERAPEPNYVIIASSLNNLGQFNTHRGNYPLAERFYRQALAMQEKSLGLEHPDNAIILHNMAVLYLEQGKYDLAAQVDKRAKALRVKEQNSKDTAIVADFANSILLDVKRGNYANAESLCQQALLNLDKAHVPLESPIRALLLSYLAGIYTQQMKVVQAEELYNHVLNIRKKMLGPDHLDVAETLLGLAKLYKHQGNYDQAEPLYEQALDIQKKALRLEHDTVVETLVDLAELYKHQKKYDHAKPLYEEALITIRKTHGLMHELMWHTLIAYIPLLEEIGQWEEAKEFSDYLRLLNPEWVAAVRAIQREAFEKSGNLPKEEQDKK